MTKAAPKTPSGANTPEELDLTGVHPNVRQSIELDFAHPRHSTKRAILAFLGKQTGVTESREDICSKLDHINPDTVHQNLNNLAKLSDQFEKQYGWQIIKTYTKVQTGPKTYTKIAHYTLEITRDDLPKRRHALCEDLISIQRETEITAEKILEICNRYEILLTTTPPDDVEERIQAARELFDLNDDAVATIRTLVASHGAGVSNKHLRAELDLPPEEFRRFECVKYFV